MLKALCRLFQPRESEEVKLVKKLYQCAKYFFGVEDEKNIQTWFDGTRNKWFTDDTHVENPTERMFNTFYHKHQLKEPVEEELFSFFRKKISYGILQRGCDSNKSYILISGYSYEQMKQLAQEGRFNEGLLGSINASDAKLIEELKDTEHPKKSQLERVAKPRIFKNPHFNPHAFSKKLEEKEASGSNSRDSQKSTVTEDTDSAGSDCVFQP